MSTTVSKFFVKTLAGKPIELDITPGDTVLSLKEKIREKEGIDVNKQRLVIKNQYLVNSFVLDENYLNTLGRAPNVFLIIEDTVELSDELCHMSYQKLRLWVPNLAKKMDGHFEKQLTNPQSPTIQNMADYWDSLANFHERKQLLRTVGIKKPMRPTHLRFSEFHASFLATFEGTNSTGVKQVLKKMSDVTNLGDESEQFRQVGHLMMDIANNRKTLSYSHSNFFGPGRSRAAQRFYDYAFPAAWVAGRKLDSAALFTDLMTQINCHSPQPGHIWKKPTLPFARFCQEFEKKYKNTNSTGIKKVLKQMEILLQPQQDSLKETDHYKFNKICKIMGEVTRERGLKKPVGRRPETKEFYRMVAEASHENSKEDMDAFVKRFVPKFDETLTRTAVGPRPNLR